MKRKILSIAFIAISTILFTSVAQNENKTYQEKCKKECCKEHKMKEGHKGHKPCFNPFEGITLTNQQKEQLKALAMDRNKCPKCKGKAPKDRQKGPREMRKQQLDSIKKILTHEQYVQYLENIAMHKPKKQMKHMHRNTHDMKCAKKDSCR